MKIDEAIEILDNYLRGDEPDYAPDLPLAIKLGIEALKRVRDTRVGRSWRWTLPLQGETGE